MNLASKLNSQRNTVAEGIDTKELEYIKVADIDPKKDLPFVIRGFIFNTGGDYGKSVTVLNEKKGVNLPQRYVELFEQLDDDEVAYVINGGLSIVGVTKNVKTKKGTTTIVEFKDNE